MFKFEELNVYTQSLDFVKVVYNTTDSWPKREVFGLTDQLRRASVSIVLNIAEGASRTSKDFSHFLSLSRGSVYECVAILAIAKDRKYVEPAGYEKMYEHCVVLAKMISGLRTSLSK